MPTDEHGEYLLDGTRPVDVVTDEQAQRWDLCVAIAEKVTRQENPHFEVMNFARVLYDSPRATDDEVEKPERPTSLREGFTMSPEALRRLAARRHRTRLGTFAHEPMRPDGTPAPPRRQVAAVAPPLSPGISEEEIDGLGLNDWPQPGPAALALLGEHKDTTGLYRLEDRKKGANIEYDAARREIHDQAVGASLAGLPRDSRRESTGIAALLGPDHKITQKLAAGGRLAEDEKQVVRDAAAKAREGGQPHALFLGGGPASGKTTVLNHNPDLRPPNAVLVDADDLKEHLPEYRDLREKRDRYAAMAVHQESGDLAARLSAEARDLGLNVVIDGTGDHAPGEFLDLMDEKRKAGYRIGLLYVNTPTSEAIRANISRAETDGRFVPLPKVRELHAKVSQIFSDEIMKGGAPPDWLDSLDVFNRHGRETASHVATLEGGDLHRFDAQAFAAFLAKKDEPFDTLREQMDLMEADEDPQAPADPPGTTRVPPEEWVAWPPMDSPEWGFQTGITYSPKPEEGDG